MDGDGPAGAAAEEEEKEERGEKATWVHVSLVSYVDARFDAALPPNVSQLEMGEGFKRFRIVDTVLL